MHRRLLLNSCSTVVAGLLALSTGTLLQAYVPDDPWTVTASGPVAAQGSPTTLTWSIAPDGTNIPGEGASNLIDYLDGLFNVTTTTSELSQRPWFSLLEESFDRWTELGGIQFVYEPKDNGAQLQTSRGIQGVRGDIRLGGAYVDGNSNTLAYTWLPNSGDMVVDTGETSTFSNPANNYRELRNTIMHELGHAFGLLHVESSTSALLMEPYLSTAFDGPQLDDIRGLHGLYGDAYEKANNFAGNDSAVLATSLGSLAAGQTLAVGSDAATSSQAVYASQSDYVSITNASDIDYYSFTLSSAGTIDLLLTPLGGVFSQGADGGAQSTFNANSRNNLSLAVYGSDGVTLLDFADETAAGSAEVISSLSLSRAGEYFVRVAGQASSVQLYELELSFTKSLLGIAGDFNSDGKVDGEDFSVWQQNFGKTGSLLAGDGNGDGVVDSRDLSLWQQDYGASTSLGNVSTVPEPSTLGLVSYLALWGCGRKVNRELQVG